MTDREPFAVVKSGRGAGFLYVGGDPVLPGVEKGSDRVLMIVADKINAAHEAAVKKAVEEFREKAEWADRMADSIRKVDSAPSPVSKAEDVWKLMMTILSGYDRFNGKPEGEK